MDEQSSTESNNSQSSNENALKEKELLLKAREIYLKEQETKHKLKLERRNMWLASPVLIAIVSTIFGTALGAAFQGYANFQLERQKFEFSLIQKSLEVEDKIIENQNDRKESAKKLLFLVNSGIIQSLNAESIKKLANNPDDLPSFSKSETLSKVIFSCRINDDTAETVSFVPHRKTYIKLITWKSIYNNKTPEKRCLEASANLQKSYENGSLNYVNHGTMNGKKVICVSIIESNICDTKLFDLPPSSDSLKIFSQLKNILHGSSGVSDNIVL